MSIGMIHTLLPGTRLEGITALALTELLLELHHDSDAVPLLHQREMQAGPAGYAISCVNVGFLFYMCDAVRVCDASEFVSFSRCSFPSLSTLFSFLHFLFFSLSVLFYSFCSLSISLTFFFSLALSRTLSHTLVSLLFP
jgi:hypothetical protein